MCVCVCVCGTCGTTSCQTNSVTQLVIPSHTLHHHRLRASLIFTHTHTHHHYYEPHTTTTTHTLTHSYTHNTCHTCHIHTYTHAHTPITITRHRTHTTHITSHTYTYNIHTPPSLSHATAHSAHAHTQFAHTTALHNTHIHTHHTHTSHITHHNHTMSMWGDTCCPVTVSERMASRTASTCFMDGRFAGLWRQHFFESLLISGGMLLGMRGRLPSRTSNDICMKSIPLKGSLLVITYFLFVCLFQKKKKNNSQGT